MIKKCIKRKGKVVLCMLTMLMIVVNSSVAYAGTTTYSRSASASKSGATVTSARASIAAKTTLKAHINWVALGHWVKSNGTSVGSTKSITGYKYSLVSKSHTIRAKTSGFFVDLSFTSGTQLKGSGSDATYYCNTSSWAYQIEGQCTSLVGYKEWHSISYEIKNSKTGKAKDTITTLASLSLY